MNRNRFSTLEFAVALLAAISPLFFLASHIDGDEWAKGGTGAIIAGITLAVTQIVKAHLGGTDE